MEEKTLYELPKYCCLYHKKLRLTNLQASGRVDHVVEGSGISSSNSRKSCTTLITAATELLTNTRSPLCRTPLCPAGVLLGS